MMGRGPFATSPLPSSLPLICRSLTLHPVLSALVSNTPPAAGFSTCSAADAPTTTAAAAPCGVVDGSSSEQQDCGRTVAIETYGCQMNVNDSEVVAAILAQHDFKQILEVADAGVVLLNTCAIRENAESKIWRRLQQLKQLKDSNRALNRSGPVVGVLGCMATRLKDKLLDSEKLADVVVGPDSYRHLPQLIQAVQGGDSGGTGMQVQLSLEETYADITPVRPAGRVSAFLSIMRGCNNMCSFCIVPFTRGRERSRPVDSILREVELLSQQGVKEVTLLGQNVNSYAAFSGRTADDSMSDMGPPSTSSDAFSAYAAGFKSVYKPQRQGATQFAELLSLVASVDPSIRVRFTSPHPKDFSDHVLEVIASHHNVCKQLHMPAQSGSSSCLERMRRGYTRDAYDTLIRRARDIVPNVAISTDIIVGFCGETEEEHQATVDLMLRTKYDNAFNFAYSQRDKTHAARHLQDDVPQEVKSRRLQEVMAVFKEQQKLNYSEEMGRMHLVLVEGKSKKVEHMWSGRTCTFKRVEFEDVVLPCIHSNLAAGQATTRMAGVKPGDYVAVWVQSLEGQSRLIGQPVAHMSTQTFVDVFGATAPPTAWTDMDILDRLKFKVGGIGPGLGSGPVDIGEVLLSRSMGYQSAAGNRTAASVPSA